MKTHVLRGSKQEIADNIRQISGEIRDVIVFVEESTTVSANAPVEDIFAEMQPYMVNVPELDDSRNAIYSRMDSE